MQFIADEHLLYHSPDPQGIYCYTPWICHGFDQRLFASFDIAGPTLDTLPGPKSTHGDYNGNQCKVYYSDDHGDTWTHCGDFPMRHARVFTAGKKLYILGAGEGLLIAASADNGITWSQCAVLKPGFAWHQSGGSIDYHDGKIYISMEQEPPVGHWSGGDPILMAAKVEDDLLDPASWRYSNMLEYTKAVPCANNTPIAFFGNCWLESSVMRVHDSKSFFYDPNGREVLLFMRADGCEHYAAVIKGRDNEDGTLTLDTLKRPDGTPIIFYPFPGGHMKFHIVYDEKDSFYWMVASMVETSTAYGPPHTRERRALGLYYSQNLFDWNLGGVVSAGKAHICSRHYASLVIDGDDILVTSRSGDEAAKNTHDTDMITIHRVKEFRKLALPREE